MKKKIGLMKYNILLPHITLNKSEIKRNIPCYVHHHLSLVHLQIHSHAQKKNYEKHLQRIILILFVIILSDDDGDQK